MRRILPDRPLTGAEKTARYRKRHPARARAAAYKPRLADRRWGKRQPGAQVAMRYRANHPITQYILTYKKEHPCIDCGENDPVVLEFDHVRGEKLFGLDFNRASKRTLAEVEAEVEKCDLVCANCHKKRTNARARYSVHDADKLLEQVFK